MGEAVNEWIIESEPVTELMNVRLNQWINEWVNQRVKESMLNQWSSQPIINEGMNWMNEPINAWMNQQTNEWMNESIEEWFNNWLGAVTERINQLVLLLFAATSSRVYLLSGLPVLCPASALSYLPLQLLLLWVYSSVVSVSHLLSWCSQHNAFCNHQLQTRKARVWHHAQKLQYICRTCYNAISDL